MQVWTSNKPLVRYQRGLCYLNMPRGCVTIESLFEPEGRLTGLVGVVWRCNCHLSQRPLRSSNFDASFPNWRLMSKLANRRANVPALRTAVAGYLGRPGAFAALRAGLGVKCVTLACSDNRLLHGCFPAVWTLQSRPSHLPTTVVLCQSLTTILNLLDFPASSSFHFVSKQATVAAAAT